MFNYLKSFFWRPRINANENTDLGVERKRKLSTEKATTDLQSLDTKRQRQTASLQQREVKENLNLSPQLVSVSFAENVVDSFRGSGNTVLICNTRAGRAQRRVSGGCSNRSRSLYDSFFSLTAARTVAPQLLRETTNSQWRLSSSGRHSSRRLESTPVMARATERATDIGEAAEFSPIRHERQKQQQQQQQSSTLPKQSADKDDDCVITGEEPAKSVAEIFAPCKYLAADWLADIKTSSQSLKSYRQRVETDERLKAAYWAKKREADERDLVSRVNRNLVLAERQVPLVPYKFEEAPLPAPSVEESEFPPLTDEQEQLVQRAWSRQLPGQEVLVDGFSIRVTREDLRTLQGLGWLNDNVINFYMQMLVARANEDSSLPSVHAFSTFFYPKVRSGGQAAVRRWTRRVDVFAKDILLCPTHMHNNHWTLCIVDTRLRAIHYFDSLAGGGDPSCLAWIKQYLLDEHQDKKGEPLDMSDWQLLQHKKTAPQQNNGSDCGVFCCKFADYFCKDKEFTFTHKRMPYFRRRVTAEILQKKLMW